MRMSQFASSITDPFRQRTGVIIKELLEVIQNSDSLAALRLLGAGVIPISRLLATTQVEHDLCIHGTRRNEMFQHHFSRPTT